MAVKILGIVLERPTLFVALRLLLACVIVALFVYGIRVSIEDGSVTNSPETLRHLMFWPFSLALAVRIARAFGLARNAWPQKLWMVAIVFLPVALVLAVIGGII